MFGEQSAPIDALQVGFGRTAIDVSAGEHELAMPFAWTEKVGLCGLVPLVAWRSLWLR